QEHTAACGDERDSPRHLRISASRARRDLRNGSGRRGGALDQGGSCGHVLPGPLIERRGAGSLGKANADDCNGASFGDRLSAPITGDGGGHLHDDRRGDVRHLCSARLPGVTEQPNGPGAGVVRPHLTTE
ncbi:unnamed protein product, partial [Symbiodinium sp. CCMP2592]